MQAGQEKQYYSQGPGQNLRQPQGSGKLGGQAPVGNGLPAKKAQAGRPAGSEHSEPASPQVPTARRTMGEYDLPCYSLESRIVGIIRNLESIFTLMPGKIDAKACASSRGTKIPSTFPPVSHVQQNNVSMLRILLQLLERREGLQ